MSPFYDLNRISPMPLEGDDDHHDLLQDQTLLHPFIDAALPNDHNMTSSLIFFDTPHLQLGSNTDLDHLIQHQTLHQSHHHEFIDHNFMIQEPSNFQASSPLFSTERGVYDHQQQTYREDGNEQKSGKWMSSKMRIMRKMMHPADGMVAKKLRNKHHEPVLPLRDHQDHQRRPSEACSSYSDGAVRVCSDCHTTKTPLWRSGPCGPKSLCNACGIRQRKARRALAAAAAISSGLIPPAAAQKESDAERSIPFKKRCRFSAAASNINHEIKKTKKKKKEKRSFDDIVISLSKSSAFQRVFPQDEKDAAILLMALSCGLVCSS